MKTYALITLAVALLVGINNFKTANDGVVTVLNPFPAIQEPLEKYAAEFTADTGIETEILLPKEDETYDEALDRMLKVGYQVDIFALSSHSDFNHYKNMLEPLNNETWVEDTDFEYTTYETRTVYGFPIVLTGVGLWYNKDMMEQLQIDPTSINTVEELQQMFDEFERNKETLGINDTLASSLDDFTIQYIWTFNYLFQGIMQYYSIIQGVQATQPYDYFASLISVFFFYSYENILHTPVKKQIEDFINGDVAFIYGATVIPYWLISNGYDPENIGMMGLPTMNDKQSIILGVDEYFVINKNSDVDEAKLFLNNLVYSDYGTDFYQTSLAILPPFTNHYEDNQTPFIQYIYDCAAERSYIRIYTKEFSEETLTTAYEPILEYFYENRHQTNLAEWLQSITIEYIAPQVPHEEVIEWRRF